MGVIFNGISQLGNEHLAVIRSSEVAVLQGFGYCGSLRTYVSSIRTRAFGRYIEGGCCRGVTVMRGSTVHTYTHILQCNTDNLVHVGAESIS